MEKKRHIRWDRVIECLARVLVFTFVAWVCISYFNIVLHNTEEHPCYFDWNFFQLMIRWGDITS